jgi:hypothetical protein
MLWRMCAELGEEGAVVADGRARQGLGDRQDARAAVSHNLEGQGEWEEMGSERRSACHENLCHCPC